MGRRATILNVAVFSIKNSLFLETAAEQRRVREHSTARSSAGSLTEDSHLMTTAGWEQTTWKSKYRVAVLAKYLLLDDGGGRACGSCWVLGFWRRYEGHWTAKSSESRLGSSGRHGTL